jgi:hypothetical protein
MFILDAESLILHHDITPEDRGTSDHVPLSITLSAPGSQVPATRWGIKAGSDEEASFLGDVSESFQTLSEWNGSTVAEVDAISLAFSKAWSDHAKEAHIGKCSNGWWNEECSDAIAIYRESRLPEDWSQYRRIMRNTKRDYFEARVHEIASTERRPWDLTAWTRKRTLPSHEAISFGGVPCNELGELWAALDGTYNAAQGRAVDLSFLDPLEPLPQRDWLPFSVLELKEALAACSSRSAPGPGLPAIYPHCGGLSEARTLASTL